MQGQRHHKQHQAIQWGRLGAGLALSAMLIGQSALAAQAGFSDVPKAYWADPFINYLSGRSIITGYPDNTFRPSRPVTRAEFAVMLAKSQGLQAGSGGSSAFADVPAGHWAAQAINAVAGQGWIAGYPGNRFLPNQNISMAEMYTILAKASNQAQPSATEADSVLAKFQDAASVPAWARVPVATAIKAGIDVREVTPSTIGPLIQASRANVATSIAKLVNPSFRESGIASSPQQQQGQAVNVTGTLHATANPGEWTVDTADNKRYYLVNPPDSLTGQSWFRVGNPVQLSGNIDTQASSAQRQVVSISSLVAVQAPQNQMIVTGTLKPSTVTQGAWLLQTADNKTYRIMNPELLTSANMLRFGNTVTLTGATRSDVTLPAGEGVALVASKVQTAQTSSQVAITGTLQPTTEAGGWAITGANNQKYVLLGTDAAEKEAWFKPGTEVMVKGSVRSDIPTIYQEGPVLVVDSILVSPSAIQSAQQVGLYFPNLLNALRNPTTMLGNPITRTIQGPSIPQKTIQALLQGPNDVERLQGFFVDDDIKKLKLSQFSLTPQGAATVILEAPADFKFQSNVTPQRLDEQLKQTLRQFTGIQQVDTAIKKPDNTVIWSSTP